MAVTDTETDVLTIAGHTLRSAYLTVGLSTIKGRSIATLRIENGKAFLFTSANCEED